MYEFQPQPETQLRDLYELGMLPEPTLVISDNDADEAEKQMAIDAGYDPFSGLTPTEWLASRDTLAAA